jgi:hypothetical protein
MHIYEHYNQTNIRGKSKETSKCETKLYTMYDLYKCCTYLIRAMLELDANLTCFYAAAVLKRANDITTRWWQSRDWNLHPCMSTMQHSRNTQLT